MKYLTLALLVAFSLPAMAAVTVNNSKSNSYREAAPTKEQCAATTDAKVVEQCKQLGFSTKSNASERATTVKSSKSNSSYREAAKCSPMPQCADGPFPPERPPAERLKKLDSRAQ
jgi:hypothetical protein